MARSPSRDEKVGNEGLNFLQLNLHKGRPSTNELNKWEYDIALVQEPNISKGGRINIIQAPKQSYSQERARAAIIIASNIHYWPVDKLSTRDLAVVALKSHGGQLYVASGYLDITKTPIIPELENLVNHCEISRIPLIIGVDANAHSPLWGEAESNDRGNIIEDWIYQKDLTIQNVGRSPTFTPITGVRHTIIDLTITNRWASQRVSNWEVLKDDDSLSDHKKITYNYSTEIAEQEGCIRQYTKANWEIFQQTLRNVGIQNIIDSYSLDEMMEKLEENLKMALDQVAPKKERKFKNSNTWWTDELEQRRTELKKAAKRCHNGDTGTKAKYLSLKKEYSRRIKEAKITSWRNFVSKAESAKEVSKIVQILENPPKRKMSLLTDGRNQILSPEHSLEQLLRIHFPDGLIGNQEEVEMSTEESDTDYTGICQYITKEKVKEAFKSFGDYKSPGPDELPPIALKNLDEGHLEIICLIYKRALATGTSPASWRKMRVVFIPKAGKDDYSVAKAYRPITLSNFILKGLERLIQWFLQEYIIIDPLYNQHAYTKGRSCESALSAFVDDIEHATFTKKYALAISLDCSGAFDCIQFESASSCMETKNIPKNVIKWYVDLLKGRIVKADIQGVSALVKPRRGSPQGGVLSPLIWNIIMDSLLSTFQRDSVKVIGYADDILIYIKGSDPNSLAELIQPALDRITNWGVENGLSFNPTKTSLVMFTRNVTNYRKPDIFLKGEKLKYSESFKYLGVDIHRRLSWNIHVSGRSNKCKFLLNKCRNLIKRCWGLTPARMDWIHKAIIRPKMTYGSVVWAHKTTAQMDKALTKVQRLAALSMTQPLRSTPTAGLEALLGWMPLPIHAQEMGMKAFLRIKTTRMSRWDGIGSHKYAMGHLRRWSDMTKSIEEIYYPRENRSLTHVWSKGLKLDHQIWEFPIEIYTDASKKGDNIGYGWLACIENYEIDKNFISAKDINVFQAETLAVKEALSWIKDNHELERHNKIYCDSQSVVNAINGHMAKDDLMFKTMSLFRDIASFSHIEIIWIKSHNGNTGNEAADTLANEAAEAARNIQFAAPYMAITNKKLKMLIHEHFMRRWQSRWQRVKDCRISKLFYPQVREDKKITHRPIKDLHTLAQFVTGHGLYKNHLKHWNVFDDYSCSLCEEEWEDTWHLWNMCPALGDARRHLQTIMDRGLSMETAILKFVNLKKIKMLVAFNESLITK